MPLFGPLLSFDKSSCTGICSGVTCVHCLRSRPHDIPQVVNTHSPYIPLQTASLSSTICAKLKGRLPIPFARHADPEVAAPTARIRHADPEAAAPTARIRRAEPKAAAPCAPSTVYQISLQGKTAMANELYKRFHWPSGTNQKMNSISEQK